MWLRVVLHSHLEPFGTNNSVKNVYVLDSSASSGTVERKLPWSTDTKPGDEATTGAICWK